MNPSLTNGLKDFKICLRERLLPCLVSAVTCVAQGSQYTKSTVLLQKVGKLFFVAQHVDLVPNRSFVYTQEGIRYEYSVMHRICTHCPYFKWVLIFVSVSLPLQ